MADERSGNHPREPAQNELAPPEDDDAGEPPPRGVRSMALVRWLFLALSVALAAGSWYSYAIAETKSATSELYHCPMHPEIVSDRPGECPICHMTLEKVSRERTGKGAPSDSPPPTPPSPKPQPSRHLPAKTPVPGGSAAPPIRHHAAQFTCPMHPEVVSDEPGRCPKCNMALVPLQEKQPEDAAIAPQGTSELDLSLDRVQAIGVRTAKVEEVSGQGSIRAPAIVEAPEQTSARVHVRAAGFVEAITVNQVGVQVRAGQPLFSIYSPEIYQAQSELLASRNWPGRGSAAELPEAGARRKLELLGVPGKLADKVLADNQPSRTIAVVAPIAGYVTQKTVTLGSFVTPEMTLYEIVDLSKVYVVADLFQIDAAAVRVGTPATFKLTGRPEPPQEATVDLVYPQVNVASRTTRVRMTLKNQALALVPGEYGTVEFAARAASKSVLVPQDALVDTGTQQYVFVERSPGRYSPRLVHVASELPGGFEVRGGVMPGETVVSGATFLLDSESRLRASIAESAARPARPTGSTGPAPAPPATEHRH